MLGIFNRFLSRIRSTHPLFSNKDLLILVLEYLDGKDIYQVYQVSFLLKMTIESVPSLQITLLKFRMKKNNQCISKLQNSLLATPVSAPIISKFAQRIIMPSFPMIHNSTSALVQKSQAKIPDKQVNLDLNDDKWANFVDQFQKYAEVKGFKIISKDEFRSKEDWKEYKAKYLNFYEGYVKDIKESRGKYQMMHQEREIGFTKKIFSQYKKILQTLNFGFHTMTNYRYYPNRSERSSKLPPDVEILL